MSNLTNVVNHLISIDTQKKAEPLAAQMGLAEIPEDMTKMISQNLNYSGEFTPALFSKYQKVKQLLNALADQQTPKHGHIVNFSCEFGEYDQSALLLKQCDIRKQNLICCSGGKWIDECKPLGPYGLDVFIGCGGPFEPISQDHLTSLKDFDYYETNYQFWGSGTCGNGSIYITVPMKRWYLNLN